MRDYRHSNPLLFSVEQLENRVLLSGNVDASMIGGDLIVRGDSGSNFIELRIVDGQLNMVGHEGTTINGADQQILVVGNNVIMGDLDVRLGSGDDSFVIQDDVTIEKSIYIDSGRGNDVLGIGFSSVDGDLRIYSRSGDDQIAINETEVKGNIVVLTASGQDVLSIAETRSSDLIAATGRQDDSVVVENSSFGDDTIVRTGSGNDDIVLSSLEIGDDLKAVLGSGDDLLNTADLSIQDKSKFLMRSGNDTTILDGANSFGGSFLAFAGSGVDDVTQSSLTTFEGRAVVMSAEFDFVDSSAVDLRLNGALKASNGAQSVFTSSNEDNGTDNIELSIDESGNSPIESGGLSLTDDNEYILRGNTTPGASVSLANGDNIFDDGTTVADENGEFEIVAQLFNDDSNSGINDLRVRATDGTNNVTSETIPVYFAEGAVVQFESSAGDIDVELFDADAPIAVANFFNYLARYEGSIIHRSPEQFVIQGGGFTVDGTDVNSISVDPAIPGEFIAENSNVRGTLSMALFGNDTDSGTSQWFINVQDNTNLDSVPHTVFGRVIGSSIDVVDAINDLPTFDLSSTVGVGALQETPLIDYQETDGLPIEDNYVVLEVTQLL